MALYSCWQAKGLRRKTIRKNYRDQKSACPESAFSKLACRIAALLLYILKSIFNWLQYFFCLIYEIIRLVPLWIYELFRFCPAKIRNQISPDFMVVGHRGAAAYEIENTLPALKKAIETYGANALEIDLSMTRDHQIVIWHDWDPDSLIARIRQAGLEPNVKYRPFVPMSGMWRKPAHQLDLKELREHYGFSLRRGPARRLPAVIPTFEEFLEWAAGESRLKTVILDIKLPEQYLDLAAVFTHQLFQVIAQHPSSIRFVILSPYESVLKAIKNYAESGSFSYDRELPVVLMIDPQAFSTVDKAIEFENDYASVGRPALALGPWTSYRRVVAYDAKTKLEFNAANPDKPIKGLIGWTINNRREMRCLAKMGVDGLLSDKPDKLKKIVSRLQPPSGSTTN